MGIARLITDATTTSHGYEIKQATGLKSIHLTVSLSQANSFEINGIETICRGRMMVITEHSEDFQRRRSGIIGNE